MPPTTAPRPVTIGVAGSGFGDAVPVLGATLRARGLRVGIVSGLPAMAVAAGFALELLQNADATSWLITRGISEELAARIGNDIVLVERPAPDALGHFRAALDFRRERPDLHEVDTLLVLLDRHVRTYDLVLHCTLDPARDHARDVRTVFRGIAGQETGELLRLLRIPTEPLPAPELFPDLGDRIAARVTGEDPC